MKKLGSVFGLFLTGIVLFQGCGYTRHSALPQGIQTIHVDTVINDIPIERVYAYQPGLEIDITNAIIKRMQQDGNLKIVPRDEADAILVSKLIGFEQEGLRFTSLESIEEYRLFAVLNLKLVDAKTKKSIWEEPNFSGDSEYFVTQVRSLGRGEAAARAIERLARNVVDRVVEDW